LSTICGLAMIALVAIFFDSLVRWSKNWRTGEAQAVAS
jgi:hypothetical protein